MKDPATKPDSTTLYDRDGDPVRVLGQDEYGQTAVRDRRGLIAIIDEPLWGSPDAGIREAIERLEGQRDDLLTAVEDLTEAKNEAELNHRARIKEIERLDSSLGHVESYLRGEFTHFARVSTYGGAHVETWIDALKSDEYGDLRLLTLSGKMSGGHVTWEINEYSDGSGSGRTVVPCKSEDDARQVVEQAIAKGLTNESLWRQWIDSADTFDVAVPEGLRSKFAKEKLDAAEAKLGKVEDDRKEAMALVEDLREVVERTPIRRSPEGGPDE